MVEKITTKSVAKLKVDGRITDSEIRGFIARRLPSGKVSFGYQYVASATGERRWISIGLLGEITADEARRIAQKYAGRRADLRDPAAELKTAKAEAKNTVDHVLDKWVEAHVSKLRTATNVKAGLANHVRPTLGDKVICDLKRADIINLKEKIAKEAGARMADIQIGYLRSAFRWWQLRDEEFNSPVVKGMAGSHGQARDRILTSEEIADLWNALTEIEHVPPRFPAFVRVLFLTACRRNEVARMHTNELECGNQHAMIGGASTKAATSWTIPSARYKTGTAHQVPLIPAIKKFLPECKDGFVFSSDCGKRPINGFDKPKKKLDAAIARIREREKRPPMPAWTFHDLRRTACSIMAAAGVLENVSERVLGHKIPGVRGVYDRHSYAHEKADALTRLANLIDGIVHPQPPTVVPIKRAKRAASSPV
jgi:integrase